MFFGIVSARHFSVAGALLACLVVAAPTSAADPKTRRVAISSAEVEGNGNSNNASVSANGRYVAFASIASDLVANDNNGVRDIFVRDRQQGTTRRVSVSSTETEGHGRSIRPRISAEGRYVAFASFASDLVANDTNGRSDAFVRDLQQGTTRRVSIGSTGIQGDRASHIPFISPDGRYVVFESEATNLVPNDTNSVSDVFVRDRLQGTTRRVSRTSTGGQAHGPSRSPSISADGRYVVFESDASDLVANDTNGNTDAFVRDRRQGTTRRISVTSNEDEAHGDSSFPRISASGRFVAFVSHAEDLVANDTSLSGDIFVRDRQQGTTERVSLSSTQGESVTDVTDPSISAGGRFVTFYTASAMVDDDVNNRFDVYLRDRQLNTTTRVSVNSAGGEANHDSSDPSISADGRFVAFTSVANDLVANDANGVQDIFIRGPLH
jgi:Tol biopolymer transport system component